ncbi:MULTISPECIES: SRPBCC family protein [unclassified Modestobacter]
MQLENSFIVPVPIDDAWRVLLDIERIAPCMPGAVLDSVTGDDFTGRVKVKLGPINLTYQGKASFVEKDEATHRAVIDAKGKDQRGNGTAAATITATLAAEGSTTRVDVITDLNITGRPAQFGRGVMTDVGNKLLGQFADKLAAQLAVTDDVDVDQEAAATPQEPTVAASASKAAATTAGVVEEAAMSAEGSAGEGPAKKAAAAAKKTAAAAADKTAPAKATPAKAAKATPPAAEREQIPDPTVVPAKKSAPSRPPAGTTAPPNRPAGSGPAKSTPVAAPPAPQPAASPAPEPEPIDLLEVAGGAAMMRYAAPAAGATVVLVLLALVLRRRKR